MFPCFLHAEVRGVSVKGQGAACKTDDTLPNSSFKKMSESGNSLFAEGKYEQALASYSDAISSSSKEVSLYTNRALCYLKLGQWSEAIEDCQQAVQMEPGLVKGHFFMGQALVELGRYDDAIVCLKAGHELAKQQRKNFGEDITGAIKYAKRMRWKALEEKRLQEGSEFHTFLGDLLTEHKERQMSEADGAGSSAGASEQIQRIQQEYEKRSSQLTKLFQEADEKRRHREVPDYLCGRISFELMTEPYITPSGITYERKDIEDHLQRVGHFDPVTRQELTQEQLIPNLAMKEVVDAFTAQNEWVEEY